MAKRHHEPRPRRSVRDWAWRGSLAFAAAILGFLSVTGSLAQVLNDVDPERAHFLARGNGVVTAKLAEQQFAMAPDSARDSEIARLARLALRQDATAAGALNVLGLQAQLRDETGLAKELFRYSLLLSRRELRPQIWSIEEAVSRGDIKGALRGYDIALRTSSDAPDLLFPVLTSALAEPRVRAALLPIIETKPVWSAEFVDFLANSGSDPAAAVAFIREAEGLGLPINDDHRAKLVNALSVKEGYEQAWDYYTTFRAEADRSGSRDPQFALQADVRTLFDWRTSEDARLSAVILETDRGGILDIAVPPTIGGPLLSQTQLLPPGIYRLEGQSTGIDQPDRSEPYWMLRCRDRRVLGRVTVPNSDQNDGHFEGEFTVPANCPEQVLSLVARATQAAEGVLGQINRAALVPVQPVGAGTE